MKPILTCVLVGLPTLVLLLSPSGMAGDKASPFKPFLSADAYKELSKRSIAGIEAAAKSDGKDAAEHVEVEAAILIGYTLSVKNRIDVEISKTRGAAVLAVFNARKGELKKVVEFGKTIAKAPGADPDGLPRKIYLQELPWLMEVFKNKAKGGEGVHADLQYHPKLKNLNGIEALIGALAGKKLSDANVGKVAKELPLLAYRMAAVASITHEFAPTKGAGQWRDLSNQMRDASIALADAASKKNAEGIQKAATALENSCTQCHSAFKGK